MTGESQSTQHPSHTFAWDGFSFDVPDDWNLSMYHFDKKVSSLRMEDDDSLRLQMEWRRTRHRVSPEMVTRRYEKMTTKLTKSAASHVKVEGLATGWRGFLYELPERKKLVIAYWIAPGGRYFAFIRLHFENVGKRPPIRALKLISSTCRIHDDGLRPWRAFDVNYELSPEFWLVKTQFEAGRKHMGYQWHLRKLDLWQLSVANVLLKDKPLSEFAAEHLMRQKQFRGMRFIPEGDDVVKLKRKKGTLHYEEIGRMCFKHWVGCSLLPEKNALVIAVYSYRFKSDLTKLSNSFRCEGSTLLDSLSEPPHIPK